MLRLLSWAVVQVMIFTTGFVVQKSNTDLALLNKIGMSVFVSRGAGLCLSFTSFFLLLSVCKKTVRTLCRRQTKLFFLFDSMHVVSGITVLVFGIIHSVSHYVNFYVIERDRILQGKAFEIHTRTIAGITGNIMILCVLILSFFSLSYFKLHHFEVFRISHKLYYIVFAAYLLHSTGCFVKGGSGTCYPYYSNIILLGPLLLFLYEKIFRIFISTSEVKNLVLLQDGVKIKIKKKFDYFPGEYIAINFPKVNNQYHPITISSCSSLEEDDIELCIKSNGDWSKKVLEYFRSCDDKILVKVDGPYLSPCCRHVEFDNCIFVVSGIGITPFISIIKNFAIEFLQGRKSNKKLTIYWVCRDRGDITWFEDVFSDLSDSVPASALSINIHLTSGVEDPEIVRKISQGNFEAYDRIGSSNTYLKYSRPCFDRIFLDYTREPKASDTGVFVCGNLSLKEDLDKAIKKYSSSSCKLVEIVENF